MSDQTTGQVLGAAGDGFAAEHPTVPTHEVLVSPTPADKHNTIRAAILPLACWRCDDIRFDFDSSFVRPEIANELRSLADLREKHPRATISIFGHADPVGDDVYNKQLSGRRATVIYGLLTRDADLWENLYQQEHWDAHTIQTMLATVQRPGAAPPIPSDSPVPPPGVEDATGETNSSAKNPPNLTAPYYTGAIDGQVGSQTTAAVKDFQADRGLASDGVVGPNTRRELFLAYMDTICRDKKGQPYSLDKHDDFLARGEDSGGKGDYQGCSEFNPKRIFSQEEEQRFRQYGHRDERNEENAPNRRVIALMFRPGTKASPESWPCPRVKEGITACKKRFWSNGEHRRSNRLPSERREFENTQDTFACRFYRRLTVKSPCEQTLMGTRYILRLLDYDLEPVREASCWITIADRVYKSSTDDRGIATIYTPVEASVCNVRWRLSGSTSEEELMVERDEIELNNPKMIKRYIFFYGVIMPKKTGLQSSSFLLGTKKPKRNILQVRVVQRKPPTKRVLIKFLRYGRAMALNGDYERRSRRIVPYKLHVNASIKESMDQADIIKLVEDAAENGLYHLVINAHGRIRDKKAEFDLGRGYGSDNKGGFGHKNVDLWTRLKHKVDYTWFQGCSIGDDDVLMATIAHNTKAWVSAYPTAVPTVKVPDYHIDYYYNPKVYYVPPMKHWDGKNVDLANPKPKPGAANRFFQSARLKNRSRSLIYGLSFNIVPDPTKKYP